MARETDSGVEPVALQRSPVRKRRGGVGCTHYILLMIGIAISIIIADLYLAPIITLPLSPGGAAPPAADTPTAPPVTHTPVMAWTLPPTMLLAISSPTPLPTATPTFTPTPREVNYQPMVNRIEEYIAQVTARRDFDIGVGFVDLDTGQVVSIDGYSRYHSMSTFKGPLGAFYLWLVERDLLEPELSDIKHIVPMIRDSSNRDTTCIFKRVGGLAPFNDWLAGQGFSRENNFVYAWQDWPCYDGGYWNPHLDLRYSVGDAELGLTGGWVLLHCPAEGMLCNKAFTPVELAQFYARLYWGEVLDAENTALLMSWLKKSRKWAAFLANLPEDSTARAYVKNGFHSADEEFNYNVFGEGGIVETEHGAYALAVLTQRNPVFPGDDVIAEIARIVYEYYLETH